MLKSKIHRAVITQCDPDYEGSVSIDSSFMREAGILPYEQVDIYDITNGARFTTYAIEAPAGSAMIGINGAAARLVSPGDFVIICAYARMEEAEARQFQPKIVLMKDENRIAA